MLGKLIKYEIKAFGRVMLPLYAVAFVASMIFSVMIRLSINGFAKSLLDRFAFIAGILFVAVMIAVMVAMVFMIIQRFYRNLLGTEGYLMFTLPVNTLQLILSKLMTAVLWIIIGGVVGTAAGFASVAIVSDLSEFIRQMSEGMRTVFGNSDIAVNMVKIILLIFIGVIASITKVYAAIAIGHQMSSHRILGAILAYIGISILELAITAIPGVRSFLGTQMANTTFSRAFISGILVSLLQILLYGSVTWWLLDRRLNLE